MVNNSGKSLLRHSHGISSGTFAGDTKVEVDREKECQVAIKKKITEESKTTGKPEVYTVIVER